MGTALLALEWSSFRGCQTTTRAQVRILADLEAVYTVLACVNLLRHLLFARYPFIVWLLFAVCFIFAAAWIVFVTQRERLTSGVWRQAGFVPFW